MEERNTLENDIQTLIKKSLKPEALEKNLSRRRLLNSVFLVVALIGTVISMLFLAALILGIYKQGAHWLSANFLTNPPSRFPQKAGILPAIVGSLWLTVLTALISIPIGVASAIYLEEYAKDNIYTRIINLSISTLAGVPSIVYGIFGLAIFVRYLAFGRSILSGALTLSLLILPTIIVSAQEAIRTVPMTYRMASYALGASKLQTVFRIVLTTAFPGLMTGVILSLARAIGETAPLITIGALAYVVSVPKTVWDPFTALPIQIYNWSTNPKSDFRELAAAAILVLLGLFLILNAIAVYLRHRFERRLR